MKFKNSIQLNDKIKVINTRRNTNYNLKQQEQQSW